MGMILCVEVLWGTLVQIYSRRVVMDTPNE